MSPSLHHVSGQESKLHMNIRSENFLVDENNKVKVPSAHGFFFMATLSHFSCCSFFFQLGGLEHSQTVQSLKKRKEQKHIDKNFSSMCYSAPELFIDHEYGTECDIYRSVTSLFSTCSVTFSIWLDKLNV